MADGLAKMYVFDLLQLFSPPLTATKPKILFYKSFGHLQNIQRIIKYPVPIWSKQFNRTGFL